MLLAAQGFRYDIEAAHTVGRSDLVATCPNGVFIFELKVDKSAAVAMRQIRKKDYAASYRAQPLPIWGVALCFNSKTRQLADFDVERL